VKIDRSFIKDLDYEGNGCTTMVRGIIGLAHNLKLQVVAEGVETEEQFAVLRTLGSDVNQGFYLHRPMSSEAVGDLLQQGPSAMSEALKRLEASTRAVSPNPLLA
jgi:EAL domain-containing protein (putative c-di-GMP-specific phosphodiesterase class I)